MPFLSVLLLAACSVQSDTSDTTKGPDASVAATKAEGSCCSDGKAEAKGGTCCGDAKAEAKGDSCCGDEAKAEAKSGGCCSEGKADAKTDGCPAHEPN